MSFALAGEIEVSDISIKLPPSSVIKSSAATMFIKNNSAQDLSLVKVDSDIAEVNEIHFMKTEGGMMRMRKADEVLIPAKSSHDMKKSGFHVMLIHLKKTLVAGSKHPLILVFKDGKSLKVQAIVE